MVVDEPLKCARTSFGPHCPKVDEIYVVWRISPVRGPLGRNAHGSRAAMMSEQPVAPLKVAPVIFSGFVAPVNCPVQLNVPTGVVSVTPPEGLYVVLGGLRA